MSFKEKFESILQKEKKVEFTQRLTGYFEGMEFWHKSTIEFLSEPINMSIKGPETIIDFTQGSPSKKAKQMEYILSDKSMLDTFYRKARIDTHKKKPFKSTNCVSYATFVATFSQWMNPENETTLFFGSAKTSVSPKANEIGKLSDHFWVTVNGKIFDNSGLDDCSYTDLNPLFKTNDVISGNFEFEKVV